MAALLGLQLVGGLSLTAAAAPLVHTGDPDAARAVAEERLGPVELEPVSLDALRATAPARLSGGPMERCDGPLAPVPDELTRALHDALIYGELERVDALLEGGRRTVLCGEGPLPTTALARLEYLGGVGAALADDPENATARFRAALALAPDLAWDDTFPTDHAALLESARSAPAKPVELEVHPGGTLDGRPATGAASAGVPHWITASDHTVRLTTTYRDAVVLPAAFDDDALDVADDEARRVALTSLLAVTQGEGTEVVVVAGDVVMEGVAGRVDWVVHRPPAVSAPSEAATAPVSTRSRPLPPLLAVLGGAALATGGVLVTQGYLQMGDAVASAEANALDWKDERIRYDAARGRTDAGWVVTGAGAAVVGVGLALSLGGSR